MDKELRQLARKQIASVSLEEKFKIVHDIGKLYVTDNWTLESCIRNQGIGEKTFYRWLESSSELTGIFKEYKKLKYEVRREKLKTSALLGLLRLLQERVIVKTQIRCRINENGVLIPIEIITTEKVIPPDIGAVIFVLTNLDPENWKNTKHYEAKVLSAHLESKKDIENMTNEELENERIKLLNLLNMS